MSAPVNRDACTSTAGAACVPGGARRRLRTLLLLACPSIALARPQESTERTRGPIRIGTTAVILEDHVSFLDDWRRYLEQRLDGNARSEECDQSPAEDR